jgi:hypothetical protein
MPQKRERKNGTKPKNSPNDLVSSTFSDGVFADTATGLGKPSSHLKDATCFRDRYVQDSCPRHTAAGNWSALLDSIQRATMDGLDGRYGSDQERRGDNGSRLAGSSGNLETVFGSAR